jgi:hypothetical protein
MTDLDAPTPKPRIINLTKDLSENEYRAEKVVNSIRYKPGQFLTEAQVEELCEDQEWKVIVDKPKGAK